MPIIEFWIQEIFPWDLKIRLTNEYTSINLFIRFVSFEENIFLNYVLTYLDIVYFGLANFTYTLNVLKFRTPKFLTK